MVTGEPRPEGAASGGACEVRSRALIREDVELLREVLRALRLCSSKLRIQDESEHLSPSAEQEAANDAIFNLEERLLNE